MIILLYSVFLMTKTASLILFFCGLLFNFSSGELFGALRGRLYDSNKNLIMATLSTIGAVASAMGPAVEKSSKVCFLVTLFCVVCISLYLTNLSLLLFAGHSLRHIKMSW